MAEPAYWIVVYNRIPELIAAVEANTMRAVKEAADRIAVTMRELAPVDTGFLKSSIDTVSTLHGKEAEVVVGAPYGGFVNSGTRFMPAQPFFDVAIQAHQDEFFNAVGAGSVKL